MLIDFEAESELAQGDIICRHSISQAEFREIGVILTADCDIAQRKTGGRLNWLRVVSASDYLDAIWAPAQVARLVDKQLPLLVTELNALLRKSGHLNVSLDAASTVEWLQIVEPEDILKSIGYETKSDQRLLRALRTLAVAVNRSESRSLKSLKEIWAIQGLDSAAQSARLKDALISSSGFSDFVFLPEMPQGREIGFCVLLRSIEVIDIHLVYKTCLDARIDGFEQAFYRIGRLSDSVRYSVAQKLAFLFSRIGMSENFEEICESASSLCVEEIIRTHSRSTDGIRS